MRPFALLFVFFTFAYAQNSLPSEGGNITPLELSIIYPATNWGVFFGPAVSPSSGTVTLTVPDPRVQSSQLLPLIQTNLYYWVSDSPSPLLNNLSAPNLSLFNSKYGLEGNNVAERIFNETHNFTLLEEYEETGGEWVMGSAVYFSGRNASGQPSEQAYVQGLFQSGDDFIFMVPVSPNSTLQNGTQSNFVFALPHKIDGANWENSFFLFSTLPPSTEDGGHITVPVPFRWQYTENGLLLTSVPGALVFLRNADYRSASGRTDIYGNISFNANPGRYHLTIIASGYLQAEEDILLLKILPPSPPSQNQTGPPSDINVTSAPNSQIVCFDGQCFVRTGERLSELGEISCTGGICKFEGEDIYEFMARNNFTRQPGRLVAGNTSRPQASAGGISLDALFGGIGSELAGAFRAGSDDGDKNIYVAVAALALFVGLSSAFIWNSRARPPRAGHD